jgi:hypothetical protein
MDNFFDKYGMLTIITDWEIKSHKDTVATYIGGTAK